MKNSDYDITWKWIKIDDISFRFHAVTFEKIMQQILFIADLLLIVLR